MEQIEAEPFASCTLAAEDRRTRANDFGQLFAAAVRAVDRPEPTRLRLQLQPTSRIAAKAAELAVAETACCSFFTFNLEATVQRLVLDITVPPGHTGALDALASAACTGLET